MPISTIGTAGLAASTTLTTPTLASANITTALTLTGAAGTSGQYLTSAGSGAAPTWTTVSAPSAATPTALGSVYGKTDSSTLAFLGYQAGNSNTGSYNVGVGYRALYANTSGGENIAMGYNALRANTTGASNISIGTYASYNNTTGSENVASGYSAMFNNTTGTNSVAIGTNALYAQTSGLNNTAVGHAALQSYVGAGGGEGNCAFGKSAGQQMTSGAWNIMVGAEAGKNLLGGNFSVLIGMKTQGSTTSDTDFMVISAGYINAGTGAVGKGNNTGYIVPGSGGMYQGNNSSSWSTTSDRRLKKNIVDNTEGLDIISQIRVRNFEYRLPEEVTELAPTCAIAKTGVQLGVIAQELQQVCPDCIKEESTGVLSVDSDNLTWHMINAIKDLKAINDTQAATITALTARITALESRT